jgi:hypothetical protein
VPENPAPETTGLEQKATGSFSSKISFIKALTEITPLKTVWQETVGRE